MLSCVVHEGRGGGVAVVTRTPLPAVSLCRACATAPRPAGHKQVAAYLLEHGAKTGVPNTGGNCALHIASQQGLRGPAWCWWWGWVTVGGLADAAAVVI